MRLLQSRNNTEKSNIEVSPLAININLILYFFKYKREISLNLLLQRLRFTALPTFLLAITMGSNRSENKKKATKDLETNFVPLSKISWILDFTFVLLLLTI